MNESELERIYDAHASGLFHYFFTFTEGEPDARDLLQELFIKLARGVGIEMRNEKACLYRLAHNLAIDWLRRRKARENMEEAQYRELNGTKQVVANLDAELLARTFTEAMEKLPEEQRTVVELKLCEALTFEEISEAQGIPLNTAASRYRYGLDKLRALLRPIHEEMQ